MNQIETTGNKDRLLAILAKHRSDVEGAEFLGVPIEELSVDELRIGLAAASKLINHPINDQVDPLRVNLSDALPDMDYFDRFPAPMFEAMFKSHIGPVNSTTTYFGPFMYWLCRCSSAFTVMEIGLAQGWTSFFMANAVTDEARRHGIHGTYYGVDIGDKTPIIEKMRELGIDARFIQKDSLELEPSDWDNKPLDLVFQDGWHSTEYVMDELEILYPYLKSNGEGWWVMHDVYSWCEEAWPMLIEKYNFEYIRFMINYGLGVLRKMDGCDPNKRYWTGPQEPPYPLGDWLHKKERIVGGERRIVT